MANRNQTEVTTIDKLFYAPPFIVDVRQEGENDGLDDYSQNDLSGSTPDNPQAPQLPGSGANPTVVPPTGYKVISQTVRIGPDGNSVVDLVLEFPDQNGVQSVDVGYTVAT